MRDMIIGFLLATFFFTLPARALDVQMTSVTVRDLFAASVMCGLYTRGPFSDNEVVDRAFRTADYAMTRRNK